MSEGRSSVEQGERQRSPISRKLSILRFEPKLSFLPDGEILKIEPPDGGYGWIIVAAAFFVHIFVLGNIYSFGVFFHEYVREFKSNQATLSWIGSLGSPILK